MFKTLFLLMRGSAASAAEDLADRNALLILDQQIREVSAAIEQSKRALALAIAQDEMEARRLEATIARIADLEVRVKAALKVGKEGIAREGADSIAALEADRDAAQKARTLFATEIARLRTAVSQAGQRLVALERGRRVARAAESVRAMRKTPIEAAGPRESTLSEAEATLHRLRERQAEIDGRRRSAGETRPGDESRRCRRAHGGRGFRPPPQNHG